MGKENDIKCGVDVEVMDPDSPYNRHYGTLFAVEEKTYFPYCVRLYCGRMVWVKSIRIKNG